MPDNVFAISLNSYSYGRFDVAECQDDGIDAYQADVLASVDYLRSLGEL